MPGAESVGEYKRALNVKEYAEGFFLKPVTHPFSDH